MTIEETNKHAKALIEEAWKDGARWQQNYDEAKRLLERALGSSPHDEPTLINYGTVLCDMGDHQEAIGYFEQAIDQGSVDRHAYTNLGVALLNCATQDIAMAFLTRGKSKQAGALTWEAYFDPMGH